MTSIPSFGFWPTPDALLDDTVRRAKKKDQKAWGECRSKWVILETYDAMQRDMNGGAAYEGLVETASDAGAMVAGAQTGD